MLDYYTTTYGDAGNTRDIIIDSLKAIYDRITGDKKFMIFAQVFTVSHDDKTSNFEVYAGFGWGDYVEFNEERIYDPNDYPNGFFWNTTINPNAPTAITNAVVSMFGYLNPVTSNTMGFFPQTVFRKYNRLPSEDVNWSFWMNTNYAYYSIDMTNPHPNDNWKNNIIDFDIFWQQHNIPNLGIVHIHNYLTCDEVNFYVAKYQSVILYNDNNYGLLSGFWFISMNIIWNYQTAPNNQWYKWYNLNNFYAKPLIMSTTVHRKELGDWGN